MNVVLYLRSYIKELERNHTSYINNKAECPMTKRSKFFQKKCTVASDQTLG